MTAYVIKSLHQGLGIPYENFDGLGYLFSSEGSSRSNPLIRQYPDW